MEHFLCVFIFNGLVRCSLNRKSLIYKLISLPEEIHYAYSRAKVLGSLTTEALLTLLDTAFLRWTQSPFPALPVTSWGTPVPQNSRWDLVSSLVISSFGIGLKRQQGARGDTEKGVRLRIWSPWKCPPTDWTTPAADWARLESKQ